MSALKEKIPAKFQDMYIMIGGNPNYADTAELKFNKKTGQMEDRIKSCSKCLAIIPSNANVCTQCSAVSI